MFSQPLAVSSVGRKGGGREPLYYSYDIRLVELNLILFPYAVDTITTKTSFPFVFIRNYAFYHSAKFILGPDSQKDI